MSFDPSLTALTAITTFSVMPPPGVTQQTPEGARPRAKLWRNPGGGYAPFFADSGEGGEGQPNARNEEGGSA